MGRVIWVWLVLSALLLTGQAFALERQLAGIRLGQSAIELLTNQEYLSPLFVGPIGLSITPAPVAFPVSQPVTQPGAPYGAASVYQPPAAMGPAVAGDRRFAEEEEPGVTPSRAMPPTGLPSGSTSAPLPTYGPTATYRPYGPTSPAAATSALPGGWLWLYRRPGGVYIMAEMNADGKVSSVTVQGKAYAGSQTARGVRLGDSYSRVLSLYGYPDNTQNEGAHFVLRYYDHGLTFRLYQMKVAIIVLTSQPMAGPAAAAGWPGMMPSIPTGAAAPGVSSGPGAGGPYGLRGPPVDEDEPGVTPRFK
jgi:hypothetical protein